MTETPAPDPEFSRWVDIRQIDTRTLTLVPNGAECAALARRFDIVRVKSLTAELTLTREAQAVIATGRLKAAVVQACAVSAEDFTTRIDEPLSLRFVPATETHKPDELIEITAEDCDEIEYTGTRFDLGEAVAQTFALAIDPFATGPNADAARAAAGLADEAAVGPFAALAALKKQN
jgi:uncharacterized metal-binding protein YceD (DUF177 family)